MRHAATFLFTLAIQAQNVEIRGAYSTPTSFWNTGARLDEYAINAIFVPGGSINESLMKRATAEGAKVFAEFATLNGKGYIEKRPEAWPINQNGEQAPAATWFMGVCPTDPAFKAHRLAQLNDLLDKHDIAGVWIDYFHWHAQFEDPEPILPETCFNESCLMTFAKAAKLQIPAGTTAEKAAWILQRHDRDWRDWRAAVLADWARELRETVRRKRPNALLGLFHCPWDDREFNGARRRILGLDFALLAPHVDVFSPMVYHGRMGRPPEWVGQYVEWISKRLPRDVKIWPIVQAHDEPAVIPPEEFNLVLRLGLAGRSTGVMMFTIGAVAKDPAKMKALRALYTRWAARTPALR
jgi:hypothetical protein